MDFFTLLTFTVAYAIAVLVPGPGVAAVVARALGGGFRAALPMVLGILVGDLVYLVFAVFGLATIAHYFNAVFEIVRIAGALYLLYIAWTFWTAKPGSEQIGPRAEEHWSRTFLSGFSLTLGNPKTIVFYLALLPTVIPLEQMNPLAFTEITAIVIVVLLIIGCGYAFLAARARDMFTSAKAIRRMNKTAGVMMATAAGLVALRV
ncbi:LysE family translocator [Paradevosia shaoguanensis]|uniref:LysE family translocator n=1 Tax=Paradevosia shaoguanensis TaxID=1335043 RepID=A0AA41QNU0_9HYPH|nr:LysE family translocator [Paradevosia shaoguanensis]MCF1743415.1 LysE family translocator [Paradevosia shaoguanensis]MCI0127898.1 LysE family translocator [Paradevosia shaoguanensis]QMV01262.1 LysE family translocator [Devosia sp. D6-9]